MQQVLYIACSIYTLLKKHITSNTLLILLALHVIVFSASDRINEAYKHVISQDNSDPSRSFQKTEDEQKSQDLDVQSASDVLLDSVLILCCIDAIRLYSIRTIIEVYFLFLQFYTVPTIICFCSLMLFFYHERGATKLLAK